MFGNPENSTTSGLLDRSMKFFVYFSEFTISTTFLFLFFDHLSVSRDDNNQMIQLNDIFVYCWGIMWQYLIIISGRFNYMFWSSDNAVGNTVSHTFKFPALFCTLSKSKHNYQGWSFRVKKVWLFVIEEKLVHYFKFVLPFLHFFFVTIVEHDNKWQK